MTSFSPTVRNSIVIGISHIVMGTYYLLIVTYLDANVFGLAFPIILTATFAVYYIQRVRPNYEGRWRDHAGMVLVVGLVFQSIGFLIIFLMYYLGTEKVPDPT